MRCSVVIVDDHAGFRARARVPRGGAGYVGAGEGRDGESGGRAARELRPEVVLLDVQLPDITGVEVARRIGGDPDPPAIILISSRDAADYGGRIGGCGARGFIG